MDKSVSPIDINKLNRVVYIQMWMISCFNVINRIYWINSDVIVKNFFLNEN